MSTHSNHLSKPMRDRELRSKAPQAGTPPEDLQEALTQYLEGRQRALYQQLRRDDPETMASPSSQDSLREVLGKLKEVEGLKQELTTLQEGIRNARHTRKPYA